MPPRFDVYRAVSQQIRAIFARYTSLIQPLSLDEAYLDVTAPLVDRGSATAIAEEIRAAIRLETGLTASAGVSYNKFLAKLASDYRKPDGLFVITPSMGPDFVSELPVAKFHGVGPVTAARMNSLGIYTGLDLRRQTQAFLTAQFGKAGNYFYQLARAEDDRPVVADHPRKSLGAETDLCTRPSGMGRGGTCTRAGVRQTVGGLQPARPNRADCDGEDQVRQLPADHSQPVLRRGDRFKGDDRAVQPRSASAPLPAAARRVRLLGVTLSNFDAATVAERRQTVLDLAS